MSTAASAKVPPATADQITAPTVSSVDALVERLAAEVAAARERVRSLQTKAAEASLLAFEKDPSEYVATA